MPEGDTIFRAATALGKALVGARVARFRSEKLGPGPVGQRVESVEAQGKNLIVRFEKGRALRTHMMLHGSWHIYREGERWRQPAWRARVELHADNGLVAVCFSAPIVEWLREDLDLGPDATRDDFDATESIRRLRRMAAVPIERALLDQRAIAGIGNVIKCEALFVARIDPFAPVGALPAGSLTRAVEESHRLLLRNRTEGPRASRTFGSRFWVYGRAGRPCLRCGEAIRVRRSARLTYFCAHCQRPGARRPADAGLPAEP
jgi:endonuclease-8